MMLMMMYNPPMIVMLSNVLINPNLFNVASINGMNTNPQGKTAENTCAYKLPVFPSPIFNMIVKKQI